MVYQWKMAGLYKTDAQTAGEEIDRIYNKYGTIKPAHIVDESRPETAPLHKEFEWNDKTAAEKYREQQAAAIVRHIVVVREMEQEQQTTRAFVHINDDYKPVSVVASIPDEMEILLKHAYREMKCFMRKYSTLKKIKPVLDAMEEAIKTA